MATTDTDQVSTEDLQRYYWWAFTTDHDEAAAARSFTARYGQPPAHIIESKGNLLLGPIPRTSSAQSDEATP